VLSRHAVLFGNSSNRVAFRTFVTAPAKESLVLVNPQRLRWLVIRTLTWKEQLRAKFCLPATSYSLAITDIRYEEK
jgi:hypothetical protein